jgi:hypothetical protein
MATTTTAEPQLAALAEIETLPPQEPVEVKKPVVEKDDANVETGSIEEPEKGYYSKLSVWLMVLFSGLAIGSDG